VSNLPPPSSGGPPHQPEQPTTAFSPLPPINAPQPKKSSKRIYAIVGAAVVVVAALVVGGILIFGGSDDNDNKVDSHQASGVVDDVTAAAKLDKATHVARLGACPFDGLDDLAKDAPKDFDAGGAAKGDDQAAVTQTDERDDPLLLQCATGNETLQYGVAAASLPPTDLQAFIGRTLTAATPKFEDTAKFRGGTLQPFCTKPDAGSSVEEICSTVWSDKELMVAIFASGKGATTTELTTAWIKSDLDKVITDLEGADADGVKVTDTVGFDLDGAPARSTIDKMIAAADVGTPDTQADQPTCAVADMDALLDTAPSGLDQGQVREASVTSAIGSAADKGDPSFVQCLRANGGQTVMYGVFIADPPPDDFQAYAKRSSGATAIDFADPFEFRGGTLQGYCGKDDTGTVTFCETDWLSPDIQVGIFANFDGVTADDTTAWLQANIETLLTSIAAADPTTVVPAAG
jgi:hypothetical protein